MGPLKLRSQLLIQIPPLQSVTPNSCLTTQTKNITGLPLREINSKLFPSRQLPMELNSALFFTPISSITDSPRTHSLSLHTLEHRERLRHHSGSLIWPTWSVQETTVLELGLSLQLFTTTNTILCLFLKICFLSAGTIHEWFIQIWIWVHWRYKNWQRQKMISRMVWEWHSTLKNNSSWATETL